MLFIQFRWYSSIRNVGFIGLGQMGKRMVKNILNSGNSLNLTLFDSCQEARHAFIQKATIAESWKSFQDSDAVFLMLPTGDSVKDVLFNGDCLTKYLKKGSVVVNSGTIGVEVSKEIEKELELRDIVFLDAPVSGGTMGAEKATLTFMIGGKYGTIKPIEPILMTMGKRIVHCGEIGKGQAAKICNNMLLAVTMLGVSETFVLAEKLCLDTKILSDIINTSSGKCWVTDVNNPVPGIIEDSPASHNYNGGFAAQLLLKDIRLALQESLTSDLNLCILKSCERQFSQMIDQKQELAFKDMSVIYQYLKEKK